jgi:Ca2+-transporting ATPase
MLHYRYNNDMTRMGNDGRLNYYQQTATQVIDELRSHRYGLTNPEAARRLAQNGANILPYTLTHTPFHDLVGQVQTWPFAVLIVGVGLSCWQQDGKLALLFIILAIIVTFVSAWRERRVGSLSYNLSQLLPARATVHRNGIDIVVDAQELVVGDLVVLEPLTHIAADVRLIETTNLAIDESQLHSGHALVHKFAHTLRAITPPNQRHNMAFAGSQVMAGNGIGIVVAAGAQTELGRLLSLAQATAPKHSLFQKRLSKQAERIAFIGTLLVVGLIVTGAVTELPLHVGQTIALSLAAALAPAGALIGVSALLYSTGKQASRSGVRFQSVSAIDRLGKIDVALLDDLDLLIRPEPLARQLLIGKKTYVVSGEGYSPSGNIRGHNKKPLGKKILQELSLFFEVAVLTSQAKLLPPDSDNTDWHIAGTANDGVLLTLAAKAGYHAETVRANHHSLQRFPYNHNRGVGSSVYEYNHRVMAFVHGNAEKILNNTVDIWDGGHTRTCTATDKKRLTDYMTAQTAAGNHIVALAYRTLSSKQAGDKLTASVAEKELTLLGLVAVGYPIKLEVPEAVQTLLHDGVAPSLFTNHTGQTAAAIARQIGLADTTTLDTSQLNQLDDTQLFEQFSKGGVVITHATPEDRLRLVDILQRGDRSVLISGRALRDVPAMHHASVSLASSAAYTAVQDEADVIVTHGNLHALSRQLNRSRHSITNITNALQVAFTDGVALSLLVLIGVGLYVSQHIPVALAPVMIVAITALLLPLLTAALSTDALEIKPSSISVDSVGSRVFLGLVAALLAITSFLLFFVRAGLSPNYIDSNSIIYGQAATGTLVSLTLFSWINLLFIRANHTKSLQSQRLWRNHRVPAALGIGLLLLAAIVYSPSLQALFGTEALNTGDWLSSLAIAMLYAGIRYMVRTERKHSRRAIIALHQEVHGPSSQSKL